MSAKRAQQKPAGLECRSGRLVDFRATDGEAAGPGGGFEAYAQLYGQPNDYNEIFQKGCFAASILQRVKGPMGSRVRVNDAHGWDAEDIIGTVVDAREDDKGLWVSARFSTVQSAQDVRTQLREGHLDEFSIEFRAIRETLKKIGEEAFRYLEEAVFWGLAVLPYSSQGEPALISVRGASPYLDLPIAPDGTAWDEGAAAERLLTWARASMPASEPNRAQLRRAFAVEGTEGGVAGFRLPFADIVDGRLQVVPVALMRACAALASDTEVAGSATGLQIRSTLQRYVDRLRTEGRATAFTAPWEGRLDRILVELRSGSKLAADDQSYLREALTTLAPAIEGRSADTPTEPPAAGPAIAAPPTVQTDSATEPDRHRERRAQLRAAQLRLAALTLEDHSCANSRTSQPGGGR